MWVRFPPGPPILPADRLRRRAARQSAALRHSGRRFWIASALLHAIAIAVLLWKWPNADVQPAPGGPEIALEFVPPSQTAGPAATPTPAAAARRVETPSAAERAAPAPTPTPASPPTPPTTAARTPAAREAAPAPMPPARTPTGTEPAPAVPRPSPRLSQRPSPPAQTTPHSFADRQMMARPLPGAPSVPRRAPSNLGFPAPLMRSWSLGGGSQTASLLADPYAIAAPRGQRLSDRFDVRGAEKLGPDWLALFHDYVEQNKFYPEQAIANDEDGTNEVSITIARNGQVRDLRILTRSGSTWLDLGTQSMFRDGRLPPFPNDVTDDQITIDFTMHYILVYESSR